MSISLCYYTLDQFGVPSKFNLLVLYLLYYFYTPVAFALYCSIRSCDCIQKNFLQQPYSNNKNVIRCKFCFLKPSNSEEVWTTSHSHLVRILPSCVKIVEAWKIKTSKKFAIQWEIQYINIKHRYFSAEVIDWKKCWKVSRRCMLFWGCYGGVQKLLSFISWRYSTSLKFGVANGQIIQWRSWKTLPKIL